MKSKDDLVRTVEWRPIKTAPLFENVLVCAKHSDHPVVLAMQRDDFYHSPKRPKRRGWTHTGAKWTHWMPRPEPVGGTITETPSADMDALVAYSLKQTAQ